MEMGKIMLVIFITTFNKIWRFYGMYKSTTNLAKGIGVGLLAGAAAATVGSMVMKDKKHLKKNAGKAMHAVGDFISNMEYMMKG